MNSGRVKAEWAGRSVLGGAVVSARNLVLRCSNAAKDSRVQPLIVEGVRAFLRAYRPRQGSA